MEKINYGYIGITLFEAVSSGKITTDEYNTAIEGIKVIKKCIQ